MNSTSIKNSILTFLDTTVTRKKGKFIPAITLYAVYALRTGADVPAKRFFRILENNGYQSRPAIGGDYYENLTFTN